MSGAAAAGNPCAFEHFLSGAAYTHQDRSLTELIMNARAFLPCLMALSFTVCPVALAQGDGDATAQATAKRAVDERAMRDLHCPGHSRHARDQRFRRDDRGAGPDRRFHPGDCLPLEWRNRSYVVDDWRRHQLSAPPAGYHWVQTGDDYVLVAQGSGLIRQLRLHR